MIKRCRLILLFFIVLLIGINQEVFAQKTQQITIPVDNFDTLPSLQVNINQGSIHIKSTATKEVIIKASPREQEEIANLKAFQGSMHDVSKSYFDLKIEENESQISISNQSRQDIVDLEIEVPANFSLVLKLHISGNISVHGIKGSITADNDFGNIILDDVANRVFAQAARGNIHVKLNSDQLFNLKLSANKGKVENKTEFDLKEGTAEGSIPASKSKNIILVSDTRKNVFQVNLKAEEGIIYLQ